GRRVAGAGAPQRPGRPDVQARRRQRLLDHAAAQRADAAPRPSQADRAAQPVPPVHRRGPDYRRQANPLPYAVRSDLYTWSGGVLEPPLRRFAELPRELAPGPN